MLTNLIHVAGAENITVRDMKIIHDNKIADIRLTFDHRTNIHIWLLQLGENMAREEVHYIHTLVNLADTKLSTLCSNRNPQHQMNAAVFHLPLAFVRGKLM